MAHFSTTFHSSGDSTSSREGESEDSSTSGEDPSRDSSARQLTREEKRKKYPWFDQRHGGRKRGSQNGTLQIKGKRRPGWFGEYREYHFNEDGTYSPVHRRVYLGDPTEVSEQAARAAFDQVLEKGNAMVPLPTDKGSVADSGRMCAYSEALVSADLLRKGYEVYKPLNPQCRHDLLAVKDGVYQRVEVRVAEIDGSGRPITDLSRKVGQFDVLAIVNRKGHIIYQTPGQALRPQKLNGRLHSAPLDPGQIKGPE